MKLRLAVANVWIFFAFAGWTLFCLPFGYAIALLYACTGRPYWREIARKGIVLYGIGQIHLLYPFVRIQVENSDIPLKHSKSIIVANHQSFLDLFLIEAQKQKNICLTSKSWPYRLLFFFAPVMRAAGYIDIESPSPEETRKTCIQRIEEGATLVIFPEGRRTRTGELDTFHTGAFRLACEANVPVIPMIFLDSFDIFPVGARSFTPGTIHVKLLPPVYPHPFEGPLPHRRMMQHVRELFRQHLLTERKLS